MYQLIFSKQSLSVLKHLAQSLQMLLIDFLGGLNFEQEALGHFGKIVRHKIVYYRVRWNDFRIYFECKEENALFVHYLLPKHTWNDFLFRAKFPFNEEMIEKDDTFWKFLENLKK